MEIVSGNLYTVRVMKLRIARILLAAVSIATWAAQGAAQAPARKVWQIGAFDQSSKGFNYDPAWGPGPQPAFIVGQSPVSAWPAWQPGSENPATGKRPHPYIILFRLPSRPRGDYRLTIAFVCAHPRVPRLEISINGRRGLFRLRRHPLYSPKNPGFDNAIYSGGTLRARLPAAALKAGENRLALTAVDDPRDGPGDSWLDYDALRLSALPPGAAAPRLRLEPTIFYIRRRRRLLERVRATVTLTRRVRHGLLQLSLAGHHYTAALSPQYDFGQQQITFAVRALSAPAPATLELRADGRSYRRQFTLHPRRRWRLFVVPHAHLDVGYTDYRGKVAEVQSRNLDTLLRRMPRHPHMRWTVDGSWVIEHYLATRTPAAGRELLRLTRAGQIGVPAQYANLLTGYASLEELIRSNFYSWRLHLRSGVPYDYANITDVPSYSWSYATILHALGIRYFAAASNNDRAPVLLWGRWNERSPFWWEGPDGSRVLMSYARQYFQFSAVCQLPAQAAACRQSLPLFLSTYRHPGYLPDAALLFGSQVENTALVRGDTAFARQWNRQYAWPRIELATFPDYFRYVDRHWGARLPVVRGDFGPYWEDGAGADARDTATDRADQERALSAEKLSTLGALLTPAVAGERGELRRMWQNLILYAEHTYASWDSYSRPRSDESRRQRQSKIGYVRRSRREIRAIDEQALSQLADQIHLPAPALVVFNPLSWQRSGLVSTDLDDGDGLVNAAGGQPVPLEVLRQGSGYRHVRFLARDVPALGYACYRIVRAPAATGAASQPPAALPLANTIENRFYRVRFDPAAGAIAGIYDKQLGQELIRQHGPYRANQYLYVSGGEGSRIVYLDFTRPPAQLTIHPSRPGRVTGIRRTDWGTILSYETSGQDAPRIRSEVILFNRRKQIEFINHIEKQPTRHKEAIYFAFPFAIRHPRFDYEIQNGWVNPARDTLLGGSLEWFTVRHWVRVAGKRFAAGLTPLDAPLVSLGDINRGAWPRRFHPPSATIFSYALNNYWHTNYFRVQGGRYTFRYRLTSGRRLSPVRLARMGRAAMTPLEHEQIIGNDKNGNPPRPLPPTPQSFLQVSARNVVVEDWKAALHRERGTPAAANSHSAVTDTILRLVEVGGRAAEVKLTFPRFLLKRAWIDNAVEVNQAPLAVSGHSLELQIKPHAIVTLRIEAAKMDGVMAARRP